MKSGEDPSVPGQPSPSTPVPPPRANTETTAVPAFDFRLARIHPEQHEGEHRLCDVAYRDPAVSLAPDTHSPLAPPSEPRHRPRADYPASATARINLQCASGKSRTWIDLLILAGHSPDGGIQEGQRIEVRIVRGFGGALDRTIATFVAARGASHAHAEDPTPFHGAPMGFNFNAPTLSQAARQSQPCSVDFVSQLERVSPRSLRRYHYPRDTTLRASVRCLHGESGEDGWLDVIFNKQNSENVLPMVRGATIKLRVRSLEQGYGGLPVAEVDPGFLDDGEPL